MAQDDQYTLVVAQSGKSWGWEHGASAARGLRDAPNTIDDVIVPHRGDLLLPLGSQQTQPNNAAEAPGGRGSLPQARPGTRVCIVAGKAISAL
jgi:hypothetical protein